MRSLIHHPHDALFKAAMSELAVARDLIKALIPQWLSQRIRWNTLALTSPNFVRDNLKQLRSDVIYLCRLDNNSYLYFVIEHQSKPDKFLPIRLFHYNCQLREQHLQQRHDHLPVIVNLCLYAGKKSPYPYSFDMMEFFQDKELAQAFILVKAPYWLDLTTCSGEELRVYAAAELVLQILKQGQKKEFLDWMDTNPQFIRKLLGESYKVKGLIYILAQEEHNSSQELMDKIISLAPQHKSTIMSVAQQLRNEGVEEGMEKGWHKGQQEGWHKGQQEGIHKGALTIAKSMLQARESEEKITRFTGLTLRQIEDLSKEVAIN